MAIERYGLIHGAGRPTICLGLAHGTWLTVCTTASDRSAGIDGQTKQILERFDDYLCEMGSTKSKLLTAQIWLRDMGDYEAVNAVWNAWIDPRNPPARSCVSAHMSKPETLIEIRITAAR